MHGYGLGPWFVALLFNENEEFKTHHRGSKRKTDIVLHTYVHRIASIRNVQNKNDNWVVMHLVGPFDKLKNAIVYKTLWSKKVRNNYAANYLKSVDYYEKSFSRSGAGTISTRVDQSYVKQLLGYFKRKGK